MNRWDTMNKWVITDVETDEPIVLYNGTFMEVTNFLNKSYKDGTVDVESYENWTSRKERLWTDVSVVDICGQTSMMKADQ